MVGGSDTWASGGFYEPYVGRWSRLVAREFVGWLNMPLHTRWLDVGCGTGALAATILKVSDQARLVGIDASVGFVAYAERTIASPRARFTVGDALALPVADAAFDAAVSGLVLNFVPDPTRMVEEMKRAVRPGGVVALYVWDYAGEMQLMRRFWDAAIEIDPATRPQDEGNRFPICRPAPLASLMRNVGFRGVEVRAIDVPTVFRDFADYWSPFLGGQGPAPGYAMSLDEERRDRLRDRLRQTLPYESDGMIRLIARAWAVRGRHGEAPSAT